jgi:hypothetical protein
MEAGLSSRSTASRSFRFSGPIVTGKGRMHTIYIVLAIALNPLLLHAQTKTAQPQGKIEPPEIKVTNLGLRSRPEVIKILGQPDKSGPLGSDYYSWGLTGYENGKLDEIDYQFKTRANSTEGALQKVGLKQTSPPRNGSLSYFWNSSTGPLVCCGFEMDNVVISLDFSGIMVGFKRKLGGGSQNTRSRAPAENR